jgi:hypothetical protein
MLGFLDRTHRFLRLQRRLGWTEYELDQVTEALGAADFDAPAFFPSLAVVKDLQGDFGLPVSELGVWWSDLDTFVYEQEIPSQYEAIFLDTALFPETVSEGGLDLRNDVFALAPDRSDLAVTISTDPSLSHWLAESDGAEPPAFTLNADYAAYVQAATLLTAEDLARLVEEVLSRDAVTGHVPLNLANLSLLYRTASFARSLGISIGDYLHFLDLTGLQPLAAPDGSVDPLAAQDFQAQYEEVETEGWSITELSYLLLHDEEVALVYGPVSADVDALLAALSLGFTGIADSPEAIEAAKNNEDARTALAQSLGSTLGLDGVLLEELLFTLRPQLGEALLDHAILAANAGLTALPVPPIDFHDLFELLHKFSLAWKNLGLDASQLAFVLERGGVWAGRTWRIP